MRKQRKGRYRDTVIYVLHNAGIIPIQSFELFFPTSSKKKRLLKVLLNMEKQNEIIRYSYKIGKRIFHLVRLNKSEHDYVKEKIISKETYNYYLNKVKHNEQYVVTECGSRKPQGFRILKISMLNIFFYASKVKSFIDEINKKSFYATSIDIKNNTLYKDTVEKIKDDNIERNAVNFTKNCGLVVTEEEIYVPYLQWYKHISQLSIGEQRILAHYKNVLIDLKRDNKNISGLMVMMDMQSLVPYLQLDFANVTNTQKAFIPYTTLYKNLYMLPYTNDGTKHMQIMSKELWKERMIKRFTGEYQDTTSVGFSCHHYSPTNIATLIFCIPDISKLVNFTRQAVVDNDKSKYQIICFEYQKEFVESVVKNYVRVYEVSLEDYFKEESVCEEV